MGDLFTVYKKHYMHVGFEVGFDMPPYLQWALSIRLNINSNLS
jgi:hypothetical protein